MIQLILHGIGDYILQNDWMAINKKKNGWMGLLACLTHCILYSLPFFIIATPLQVSVIFVSHFIIDRGRIVDYFLAWRNGVKKESYLYTFGTYQMILNWQKYDISNFGFSKDKPFAISVWLYIITDNIFHIISNYLTLTYL